MLRTIPFASLLFITVAMPCAAQQTLEKRLDQIERRLDALEGNGRTQGLNSEPKAAAGSPTVANFRRLQKGLVESQVLQLLGNPKTITRNQYFDTYYYSMPGKPAYAVSSVTFEGGRVTGWAE